MTEEGHLVGKVTESSSIERENGKYERLKSKRILMGGHVRSGSGAGIHNQSVTPTPRVVGTGKYDQMALEKTRQWRWGPLTDVLSDDECRERPMYLLVE